MNSIKDFPVTVDDINLSQKIYDPDVATIKGDLEDFVAEVEYSYYWITDLVGLAGSQTWSLIRLFQSCPGRTYDPPKQADIFVVPYLYMAHCMKAGYWILCKSLPDKGNIKRRSGTFAILQCIYGTSTFVLLVRNQNLFLIVSWLMRQPLLAMYVPRWNHNGERSTQRSPPGHILIPPFNPLPKFQPSVLWSNQQQTQPVSLKEDRKYSLVFVATLPHRSNRL
ncbi:hypothetical protein IV203_028514 [Nitzschia inconspicua]|uniref:Uncharacterized protein n=1 Tax=Nitzschia inconspicua TaxID=303405 RepID=A0A9K3LQ12_9STRA|nr:hypothetical protein IV203_028514 [Nitzschia inconspicua]